MEVGKLKKGKYIGWNIEELDFDHALHDIRKANSEMASVIEEWDPTKNTGYRFFKIKYRYGEKILLNGRFQLPLSNGRTVDISDSLVPVELKQELSYSNLPMGIILTNSVEVFSVVDEQILSLAVFEPGVPLGLLETLESQDSYCFRKLWCVTAGARSAFMVPKISDKIQHAKIQRALGCDISAPREHTNHFDVFTEIANMSQQNKKWEVSLLVFSKRWFEPEKKNVGWVSFYAYLQKYLLLYTGFSRNKMSFELTWHYFLKILEIRKKRVNFPIFQMLKNLIMSALGVTPSFSATHDNSRGPFELIKKIYLDIYGLEYSPTIMVPVHFSCKKEGSPAYYSPKYQNPFETNPKNKITESLITDLYQLNSLLRDFIDMIDCRLVKVEDTLVESIVSSIDFQFYHINPLGYKNILDTKLLPKNDKWLIEKNSSGELMDFPHTSNYFRSCIQIKCKKNTFIDRPTNVIN